MIGMAFKLFLMVVTFFAFGWIAGILPFFGNYNRMVWLSPFGFQITGVLIWSVVGAIATYKVCK